MNRYAVSDLHGQLDLYNQIKEYINDDDILYVLGDCNDRGPEPWRTLQAVIDDPQCILLMGNHEHMLWQAAEVVLCKRGIKPLTSEFIEDTVISYMYSNNPIGLLTRNGGADTLMQMAREQDFVRYYNTIRGLPLAITLPTEDGQGYIYLSHAGYNPGEGRQTVEDFVWNRNHYNREWKNRHRGDIVIYGHTPLSHIKRQFDFFKKSYDMGANDDYFIHDNGSKICIDLGAHYTGRTCLLDLDTLKPKVFETEVVNDL